VRSALIIKTMNKEAFIKKLTLILEDFDSFREVDMKYFLDDIYAASEIYFADIIKEEREKAIKEFLTEQLKRRQS
jgi:hypothetical protein